MKALIKVGYACNEHCAFCHTQDDRHVQGPTAEIDAKIRRAAALGHTMAVLSGGEPTIRPELLHWARLSASLGMDLGLVTNGLRLAYPALVDRLLSHRLRYVYLSLHGGSATVHDRCVRTEGAFGPAMAAVENLHPHADEVDLTINCVVTRANVEHLIELVDRLRPFPRWKLKLSMVEPKGGARHLLQLVPRVSHVAKRVREAIEHGLAHNPGQTMLHGGLPLCLLPGLESRFDDLRTHGFRTMIEVGEPDFFPVDDLNKCQPEPCQGCALAGPCPGLFRVYAERHGHGELRPVRTGTRANAFNYSLERVLATNVEDDDCPLRSDGPTPWDRGRDLLVRHRGRIAVYRAETRDVSDVEIQQAKLERGQVYLDASSKPAPDDFARDLVPLQRAGACAGCPHEEGCTGLWEPSFEDRFTRDDAEVRAILEGLRGTVLDLGCGEAPYLDVLARGAKAGLIDYHGVDPDPEAITRLQSRAPWAHLHAATAEQWLAQDEGTRLDHVLVLRSWNHLPDPVATLEAAAARLPPGGTLLVVDNVLFGLARGRAQAHRAEGSSARREHHRNDGLDDAARAIARVRGLRTLPLLARPVTPGRSNQWLLHLAVAGVPAFAPSPELLA
ncbi:MAG: radical SAM protein [Myxococcales bacterium]|nr:radical SAM protein [Myxococcales bacterium]MCB9712225.1 radical SAM protein [Myxococcales bacterium]